MILYTDGSYNRKTARDVCGYSAVIVREEYPTHYMADILYGVNRKEEYVSMWNVGGELWAVLTGVDYLIEQIAPDRIDLYYDYQGIESWAKGVWQAKKPITRAYARHMKDIETPIHYHKVKGHSNVLLNEWADMFAKQGISDYLKDHSKCISVLKNVRIPRG